jgi:hypothetical protein
VKIFTKLFIVFFITAYFPIFCIAQDLNFNSVSNRMQSAINELSRGLQNKKFDTMVRPYDIETMGFVTQRSVSSMGIILSMKFYFSQIFIRTLEYDVSAYEKFLTSANKIKKIGKGLIPLHTIDSLITASWNLKMKATLLNKAQKDKVDVTVETVDDNGGKINHCFVWYSYFLRDDDQHTYKFDKPSTPTTDPISPGKYYIWTEKEGKRGPKTVFYCGDDGRKTRKIYILAPR